MEINGTYFSNADQAELANLYHLARTALAGLDHVPTRHERLIWASDAFSKANGGAEAGYPSIRCYKAITRVLA